MVNAQTGKHKHLNQDVDVSKVLVHVATITAPQNGFTMIAMVMIGKGQLLQKWVAASHLGFSKVRKRQWSGPQADKDIRSTEPAGSESPLVWLGSADGV